MLPWLERHACFHGTFQLLRRCHISDPRVRRSGLILTLLFEDCRKRGIAADPVIDVDVDVTDPIQFEQYKKLASTAVTKYGGGRYLIRAGAYGCRKVGAGRSGCRYWNSSPWKRRRPFTTRRRTAGLFPRSNGTCLASKPLAPGSMLRLQREVDRWAQLDARRLIDGEGEKETRYSVDG